ncbi:MAG TPA: M50 family metallopeptidase [Chthoniobacter sp.]|jgi:Zn-dependent protease
MAQGPPNCIRLGRVLGIDVYLDYFWIAVPIYFFSAGAGKYSSPVWNVWECIALFAIVLLHEFGHALATRQVGGRADTIKLWPLGGVAYVDPPQRPGAELWSIAAGPLVNVVLLVIFTFITGPFPNVSELYLSNEGRLLGEVWWINFGLLAFNLLPIYPLDGGQILRALLWFMFGRARSLFAAAVIGFVGVAWLAFKAISQQSIWLGFITFYAFQNCRQGLAQAQALRRLEQMPRREEYTCPSCGAHPPVGAIWKCHKCQAAFDIFESQAECPNCHEQFPAAVCVDCRKAFPLSEWRRG